MNYKKETSELIATLYTCLLSINILSYGIWPYDFRGMRNVNGVFFSKNIICKCITNHHMIYQKSYNLTGKSH